MKATIGAMLAATVISGSAMASGPLLNCEGQTTSGHYLKVRILEGAFGKMVANVYHNGAMSNFLKRCTYSPSGNILYQCQEDIDNNARTLEVFSGLRGVYHGSHDDTELVCRFIRPTAD